MNAAQMIEAAIAKLTAVWKLAPEPPYFSRWNEEDFRYGNLDDAVEEGFDYGQAYGEWKATHRTIDAQLKLLTGTLALGVQCAEDGREAAWLDAIERAGDLDLAKAILGDDA